MLSLAHIGLAGAFGALLVGWLVVVVRRLYLARHLFTLYTYISIVVISMYYVYEKGELNRKGGEGAEYKTIVITATVQWAEGDAGKL